MRSIRKIPAPLVVWVTSYIFFLFTLVNNLSASHDSVHYLIDILKGEELFHQHHLLYNILASKWMQMLYGVPPQYAVESFTAFWGSSALTIIYLFFRNRFYLSLPNAALGTAIIAFSYGVWFYSVNIEVYMPPLFFMICSLYVITKKNLELNDIWKIALLHSLAILFHQVNILFVLVVLFTIYTNRKNLALGHALAQYALISIIVVGGMYFVAGWIFEGHNSVVGWMHWMAGYTVGHGYWQPLSLKTPLHAVTGFSHAFIGGHFIFRLPVVEHYLRYSIGDHGLSDEIFLSSKIPVFVAWLLSIGVVVFGFLFIFLLYRFIKKYRSIVNDSGRVVTPMALTILIYSVFFCFWMPEILEFWILQMVLVWMLLIGMTPLTRFPFKIPTRNGLVILVVVMFAVNFFGSIRWLQDIDNDWYYHEVGKIKDQVGPNDLVVVDNEWILKDFVRYFTKAKVLATDEGNYNKDIEEKMIKQALARKGKVFIYRDRRFTRSY
jgi:hypothetical protein